MVLSWIRFSFLVWSTQPQTLLNIQPLSLGDDACYDNWHWLKVELNQMKSYLHHISVLNEFTPPWNYQPSQPNDDRFVERKSRWRIVSGDWSSSRGSWARRECRSNCLKILNFWNPVQVASGYIYLLQILQNWHRLGLIAGLQPLESTQLSTLILSGLSWWVIIDY